MTNIAKCVSCSEILESKYKNDYVTCKCGNLSVDGGDDYRRRVYGEFGFIELSDDTMTMAKITKS